MYLYSLLTRLKLGKLLDYRVYEKAYRLEDEVSIHTIRAIVLELVKKLRNISITVFWYLFSDIA